ncbi:hypothetical protein [Staphylococcus aureus]|uniref:hypothetical protein n=1 Tax=Staphylococcus aureus TaxID=1280 RepID=UPI0004AF5A02|nr:hypothetical protein [Staphylococcus aureus]
MNIGVKSVDIDEEDYIKYKNTRKTHGTVNFFAFVTCVMNFFLDEYLLNDGLGSIMTNIWNYIFIIAGLTIVLGFYITQKLLWNIVKKNKNEEQVVTPKLYKVFYSKTEVWSDLFLSFVILLLVVLKIIDVVK